MIAILDHSIIHRNGVIKLLNEYYPSRKIIQLSDRADLNRFIRSKGEGKLLITDICLSGELVFGWLNTQNYDFKIMLLSEMIHYSLFNISNILDFAIKNALTKEHSSEDTLVQCINATFSNQPYYSPYVLLQKENFTDKLLDTNNKTESFSSREREFIKWFCQTLSQSQTAEKMNISVNTVSSYRAKVLKKLQLNRVADLIAFCVHHPVYKEYFSNPAVTEPVLRTNVLSG